MAKPGRARIWALHACQQETAHGPPQHQTAGPSQRQLRVGEVLRRAVSDTLNRGDLHDPDLARVSITVGEVRVSPDLRQATVFVLPLGGIDTDAVLDALNRNRAEIRRNVTKSVSLKFSPELKFRADETFDQMDETRRLLSDTVVQRDVARATDEE
ncbi:MAG: 30S ribosome-binding factor RbfA [Pseudomonadota bacterium]